MAKSRIKSTRTSVLKSFDDELPSPEEIEKKVEAVTKPVETVVKKVEKKAQPPKKVASTKKTVLPVKKEVVAEIEVIKFVKIGGTFHRLAKIEAAKKSLSLKAYLEMIIEKNSSL